MRKMIEFLLLWATDQKDNPDHWLHMVEEVLHEIENAMIEGRSITTHPHWHDNQCVLLSFLNKTDEDGIYVVGQDLCDIFGLCERLVILAKADCGVEMTKKD